MPRPPVVDSVHRELAVVAKFIFRKAGEGGNINLLLRISSIYTLEEDKTGDMSTVEEVGKSTI